MSTEQNKPPPITQVKITSVDVPFGNVLYLMIKIGIASIPAAIIVAIAYYALIAILGDVLGTS